MEQKIIKNPKTLFSSINSDFYVVISNKTGNKMLCCIAHWNTYTTGEIVTFIQLMENGWFKITGTTNTEWIKSHFKYSSHDKVYPSTLVNDLDELERVAVAMTTVIDSFIDFAEKVETEAKGKNKGFNINLNNLVDPVVKVWKNFDTWLRT